MKTPFRGETRNDYEQLSLKELLAARDLYHIHLMQHANVVATAVGRYRIRVADSWPGRRGPGKKHGTGERTLENSEVRPYSWPCVLVFVKRWVTSSEFAPGGVYNPDDMVPKTLFLPDGRRVPVCVVRAPREMEGDATPPSVRYPTNTIGGGFGVIADVQGGQHSATIACLVTDGHKIYALTNRHVTGDAGEVLYSRLDGKLERIGISDEKQLTRIPFTDLYPGFAGKDVYVNLDVGLIEVDDVTRWSARIRDLGVMGPMVDLSSANLSLSLIGRHVCGYGSTSRKMCGQIDGLFYRYKSQGGFEYVADFLIGPVSANSLSRSSHKPAPFVTHHGDSGTLWLMEELLDNQKRRLPKNQKPQLLPLAMQWGAHVLDVDGVGKPRAYALATCLSTVCNLLNVDPVRDWNLDQTETWGAVGHFSIAARVTGALSGNVPKLKQLMSNHLEIISHKDATILSSEFKNMGSDDFVPLADVPDFLWKHGKQGFTRGNEGPNHFADMDQKRPGDGKDLLDLCKNPANVSPAIWDAFYSSVKDILEDEPVSQKHRGLLPFRVWQIFDEMVGFVDAGKMAEFICAAGVLTHYIGDACQPLHISYLHDGDPEQPRIRTVHHNDGTTSQVKEPLGQGVHATYEDDMISLNRSKILSGLGSTKKVTSGELVGNGFEAALKTVALMRKTIERIPPADIVAAQVASAEADLSANERAKEFWKKFGTKTIHRMQDGTHLLAMLWESAWVKADGDHKLNANFNLTEEKAMTICRNKEFLKSFTINQIGAHLKVPGA